MALRASTALRGRSPSSLVQMSVNYSLDGSVLTLRMLDTYSPAEIRAALAAGLAAGLAAASGGQESRPLSGLLFDLQESKSITTRTLSDMTANIGFLAYHAASLGNRVAFVLAPSVDDTLVRMASVDLGTAGVATAIFHDIGEATRWLRRTACGDSSPL